MYVEQRLETQSLLQERLDEFGLGSQACLQVGTNASIWIACRSDWVVDSPPALSNVYRMTSPSRNSRLPSTAAPITPRIPSPPSSMAYYS